MSETDQLAAQLVAVPKLLAPGQWLPSYDAAGKEVARKLECRFVAAHPQIDRLRLSVSIKHGSVSNFSFHTHLTLPTVKTTWQVFRLDVGQAAQHTNKIRTGHPFSGHLFPCRSTHEHNFTDSVVPGACDFAVPPSEDVTDFSAAVRYVCGKMNITNADDLPPPVAQGFLL